MINNSKGGLTVNALKRIISSLLAVLMTISVMIKDGKFGKVELVVTGEVTTESEKIELEIRSYSLKKIDYDTRYTIEVKKDGEWKEIPFDQMLDDVDFVYPSKLYPGEKAELQVLFQQRGVYSEPVPMPLEEGNYRLTVSYKTKGYRTVKEGKKTVEFTVMPA